MLSRTFIPGGVRALLDEAFYRGQKPNVLTPTVPVFAAQNSSGQIVPVGSITTITNWTTNIDNTGSFNAATGIYTVPTTGNYRVSASLLFNTGAITSNLAIFCIIATDITLPSSLFNGQFTALFTATPPSNTSSECNSKTVTLTAGTQLRVNTLLSGGGLPTVTLSPAFLSNSFSLEQIPNS